MSEPGQGEAARSGAGMPAAPAVIDPWRATRARWLYGLLLTLLAPAYGLRLWWRGRAEPLYRHAVGERFGFYADGGVAADARRGSRPRPLWIHAVSLGETRAAAALIDALRRQCPGLRLLLTHGTATGRAAGAALLQPGDAQCWLPYDTPGAVDRFLAHWQPVGGVLMETEIWPQLLHAAQAAGVPLLLANARLSGRSLRRGQRFAALLQPAVASLARVLAQTEADAQRLRRAGAPRVEVMGHLKFDITPDPAQLALGHRWAAASARPLVLAASTREGEEQALLDAWLAQAKGVGGTMPPAAGADASSGTGPGGTDRNDAPARLLIVPRHPQRFDEVAQRIAGCGLSLSRRSAWPGGVPDAAALAADVWLGDNLGEMPAYYAAAALALLGGSFAPLGGQNLIEAAACGCPLLMGPHTFNFEEAARLSLAAGAAERVADMPAALQRADALRSDPVACQAMSERALDFAAAHRGAASRMARAVLESLPPA
jgi:3-deoxy-D-manno-octulosonic-acid transferase